MVTMKDIAVKAGLSYATVSLILGGGEAAKRFNHTTRERVQSLAQEMGYRPNHSAQAMRQGRFGCIGLVLSTVGYRSHVFGGTLEAIHTGLRQRDLHLMIAQFPDEELTNQGFVPKILRQAMADGLLIAYNNEIPAAMIELIERHQIPAIWLNSQQPSNCVYPDDFGAGKAATERLLTLGHRRIDYTDACPKSVHYSAQERYRGYVAAMQQAGLTPRYIAGEIGMPAPRQLEIRREWLTRHDRPTALIAYSSQGLLPFLYIALHLGIKVPEELSMVTFSNEPAIDFGTGYHFDFWQLPDSEMGFVAVEMLLQRIDKPEQVLSGRVLPCSYHPGHTVAPGPE